MKLLYLTLFTFSSIICFSQDDRPSPFGEIKSIDTKTFNYSLSNNKLIKQFDTIQSYYIVFNKQGFTDIEYTYNGKGDIKDSIKRYNYNLLDSVTLKKTGNLKYNKYETIYTLNNKYNWYDKYEYYEIDNLGNKKLLETRVNSFNVQGYIIGYTTTSYGYDPPKIRIKDFSNEYDSTGNKIISEPNTIVIHNQNNQVIVKKVYDEISHTNSLVYYEYDQIGNVTKWMVFKNGILIAECTTVYIYY